VDTFASPAGTSASAAGTSASAAGTSASAAGTSASAAGTSASAGTQDTVDISQSVGTWKSEGTAGVAVYR